MPPYILAIDIGTTSTKALAVTADGKVLASQTKTYPTYYPQTGHSEQNPNEILDAVKDCLAKSKADCVEHQLLGLSFSAAMHSLMAVDLKGHPLTPLIIWSDMRSAEQANDLVSRGVGYKIYEATGTAIHPMSPLCKLMWLKKHQPDLIKDAYKFLSIKDYILHHFTGEWITDYSIASASGLFNIKSLQWNEDSMKEAGIKADQLPTPIPTTQIVTSITEDVRNQLYLPFGLKIIPGANDGCLANLGTNAVHPGELSVTIGTSGAVRMIVESPKADAEQRIFNYILSKDRVVVGGATNNGAILLQWFEKTFGTQNGSQSIYEEAEKACRKDSTSDSLIFLPYILGERAPIYDPLARGVFFGLSIKHTRQHMLRSLIEGICFSLLSIAHSVKEAVGDYNVIIASGGFIHSPGWIQLLSDVFGKEVRVVAQDDASAIGAARLGFEALGLKENFFEKKVNEVVYHPDFKIHGMYQKKFEIFLSLYRNLKQDFYNLSKLEKTDSE
ncbi:MAG: gluconokinase [Bacteroidia bacterium]|nr:gluconokinase [Bacteroidia bacterium]